MSFSPRQELIQLQKQIYKTNKIQIEESVIHAGTSFKAYENRYLKAVRDYQSVSSIEETTEKMLEASIIYVGDYHTLNQSQRSLLRVLRHLIQSTKDFVLSMEVIQARFQPVLDKYMAGRLSDGTFLRKIEFKEHWFFDLWDSFKPIFDFARENSIPIYAMEADPDKGTSLKKRDQEMARRISEIRDKHPDKKIIVFVGDLHLAPSHLPQEVNRLFKKKGKPLPKAVTLYQNSDAIYWKLAEDKLEDQVHVVRISKNEFCRMHTPPIICQQSYLNWLQHEEDILDFADAKQTFLAYVNRIADFLELELGPEKEEVEVFTCGDFSFLKKVRDSGEFSSREIKEIKRQILRSESYYIPKMKFVYLADVSVNHAAEEAAHTIRHLVAGEEFPRGMQDAFYANILHEGMGFFGSKIINHKRKCLRPTDCGQIIRYSVLGKVKKRLLEYRIATLFLEHEIKMRRGIPFYANKIKGFPTDLFLGLTHALGYYLGERMFYGLIQEKITKEAIRDLFHDPVDEEGEPMRRYGELVKRLEKVRLPVKV